MVKRFGMSQPKPTTVTAYRIRYSAKVFIVEDNDGNHRETSESSALYYEATACRNNGYMARKNLPSSRTRRKNGSFPLTGSRCWNCISV